MPPWALLRLGEHFEACCQPDGYPPRNWERGIPLSRFHDAMFRHLEQWWGGDRSEPHLVALLWNALCCLETTHRIANARLPVELNDMPERTLGFEPTEEVVVSAKEGVKP